MTHSCAFTGHRPQRFPWRFNENDPQCVALKAVLTEQITILAKSGTTDFFSGMALGVDVWAAQSVLTLREEYPQIKLHCVLPCEDQDAKWNAAAKETYHTILAQADSVRYVSRYYCSGCMLKRDRQLVELASVLLAVYDGKPSGGTAATVRYAQERMLQNEKYMGDALLQKTFSEDLFTRKRIRNDGQLPKYYVHDCHPAIIDRVTFQKVQEEIARRSGIRKASDRTKTELGKYSGKYVLSGLMVCGECGSPYRRVIWTQKGEKRVVWRCINRLEHGKRVCKHSPTWDEGNIHTAVIDAINEKLNQQEVKKILDQSLASVLAGNAGEMTLRGIEVQLKKLQERQTELLHLAFSAGADCVDYDEEIQKVNLEVMRLTEKRVEMSDQQGGDRELDLKMEALSDALRHIPNRISAFDETVVRQLVSSIKVMDKERLLVCFRDGEEIVSGKV